MRFHFPTIEELLVQCFENLVSLTERIKTMSNPPQLHIQLAFEQIEEYYDLRNSANLPKEQLKAYDGVVGEAEYFLSIFN